jgi:hypothetical protein
VPARGSRGEGAVREGAAGAGQGVRLRGRQCGRGDGGGGERGRSADSGERVKSLVCTDLCAYNYVSTYALYVCIVRMYVAILTCTRRAGCRIRAARCIRTGSWLKQARRKKYVKVKAGLAYAVAKRSIAYLSRASRIARATGNARTRYTHTDASRHTGRQRV